jgi:hypothetical protein
LVHFFVVLNNTPACIFACDIKDVFDVDAAGKRGYGYEAVDQLALDHLMGLK